MGQFLISFLFFIIVLAFFWGVLHWIRYKKREGTCTCGKGACLTKDNSSDGQKPQHKKEECNASDCKCDE